MGDLWNCTSHSSTAVNPKATCAKTGCSADAAVALAIPALGVVFCSPCFLIPPMCAAKYVRRQLCQALPSAVPEQLRAEHRKSSLLRFASWTSPEPQRSLRQFGFTRRPKQGPLKRGASTGVAIGSFSSPVKPHARFESRAFPRLTWGVFKLHQKMGGGFMSKYL